jgi:membrane protein DedA with SNARE-associated domain
MTILERLLDWLAGLPPVALLSAMSGLAALENLFPPIPADVLVAFGGLLAARAGYSPWPAFLAVWLGNVAGALAMYGLGRRYGSAAVERRYRLARGGTADARLLTLHARFGSVAFFLSRFIPGVRAVVPPVAGALRAPILTVGLAISVASGLWYGAITWLAFRTGANWEELQRVVGRWGTGSAVVAGVAVVGVLAWWMWRRRAVRRAPAERTERRGANA